MEASAYDARDRTTPSPTRSLIATRSFAGSVLEAWPRSIWRTTGSSAGLWPLRFCTRNWPSPCPPPASSGKSGSPPASPTPTSSPFTIRAKRTASCTSSCGTRRARAYAPSWIGRAHFPSPGAVSIARDVAEGLAHSHSHGVVHRDIKPANILLTGDHAVIADFGVARGVEGATMEGPSATITGHTVGTARYMSPEQALGDPGIDGRSDIYSLGCVMYEMLTGEAPFGGQNAASVMAGHLRLRARPVKEKRRGCASAAGGGHRSSPGEGAGGPLSDRG